MENFKSFFIAIAIWDFIRSKIEHDDIDFVLIFVALVCSIVGSSVQVVHTNLERGISSKEIWAIYVTGVMVAILSYIVGMSQTLIYAALIAVFGSYLSLDLFRGVKRSILAIVSIFPDVFREYLKQKLNLKDKNGK